MAGHIALIKMKVLPRFLYLFRTIPIPFTNAFFAQLRGLLIQLIWAGRQARVAWDTLTLPCARGGFAIPDPQLYFLVAQAQYAHHWFHLDDRIPYTKPDKEIAAPTPLASPLPIGIPLDQQDIQPLSTTCWAWRKLNLLLGSGPLYLPAIPPSYNPFLPLTTEKGVLVILTKLGLDTFGSLFPDGQAHKMSVNSTSRDDWHGQS